MRYIFHSEISNERKNIYARKYQTRRLRAMFAGIIVIPIGKHASFKPGTKMSIMYAAIDMLSGHNNNNTHLNRALTTKTSGSNEPSEYRY